MSNLGFVVLALNFPLNIGVTMSNKAFFEMLEFPLPVTLAAVHMLFCAVIPFVLFRTGVFVDRRPPALTTTQTLREWALALVFALHIAVSNIGLKNVSVHLFVLVKCAGPVASAVLSFLMLGRRVQDKSLIGLVLLVLGPALAVHAELDVTLFGVAATCTVVVLTSMKVVLSTMLFSGGVNWESLSLLADMAPKACLLLLPWSVFELWSNEAQYPVGRGLVVLLCLSGIFAFLLNYNNFMIFKYLNSPVSVAVFTNVRKVLTIVFSVFVFRREVGLVNLAGMGVTFLGVFLYTWQELKMKKKKVEKKKEPKLEIV